MLKSSGDVAAKGSGLATGVRKGALVPLVFKSISYFLSSGRNAKARANLESAKRSSECNRRNMKMSNEKNKCKISGKLADAMKRDTHFNRSEIEVLYKIYRYLISMNRSKYIHDKTKSANGSSVIRKPTSVVEGISRTVFCELLHNTFDIVTEDMLMERIFCVWDKQNAGLLTPEAWFSGLSIFIKGNKLEQIDYCFAVYDLNADGFITKDEMFQLLRNCLIKHPHDDDPDESVKDLVEIVLRKLDKDKDGKVSMEDYRYSVLKEPLLMETFGKCLPADRAKVTFLSTIKI